MAIYALKTGISEVGGGSFRVKLSEQVAHGAMLAYDATRGVFVDVCTVGQPLTGAINLGGANGHGILAPTISGVLQFKDIVAGPGISITSDADSIVIARDDQQGFLYVPGDLRITIDSDNDQNGNARFELYTGGSSATNPLVISTCSVYPLTSSSVYTGNTEGHGWFRITSSSDFWLQGFRAGMFVKVGNAGNQTGTFQIEDVIRQDTSGTIISELILTEPFVGEAAFNLGGPKPNVTFDHHPVTITQEGLGTARVQVFGVDFADAGLEAGMVVQINGTPDNDGTYLVEEVHEVNATNHAGFTVSASTPFIGTMGMQDSDLVRFEVHSGEVSTGFYVTSGGHLVARSGQFDQLRVGSALRGSYTPSAVNDVVRMDNIDELRRQASRARRYFFAML